MNLTSYFKAGFPILWILTSEESRAELNITETVKELKNRRVVFWSCTTGFFSLDNSGYNDPEKRDPVEALMFALDTSKKKKDERIIYIFRDLHPFLADNPVLRRLIRDVSATFKQVGDSLVVISPMNKIPDDINRDITMIEFNLPTQKEIGRVWDNLYQNYASKLKLTDDECDQSVQSALGLTTNEAESAFSKAIIDYIADKDNPERKTISRLVLKEKAQAVKKGGILEYYDTVEDLNSVGGLDNLKNWLKIRSKSFTKKAREFGLPPIKGIALLGLPGCGKCVKEDSLIVANGTLLRIGNVAPSHKDTIKHAEVDLMVQSDIGIQNATQFHWVGLSKTKCITLSNGMSLEGRHEHPVRILSKTGYPKWIKLSDLRVGDIVLTRLGADDLKSNTQYQLASIDPIGPYNDDNGDHRSCGEKPVRLPETVTEDFAYWIGLLTGDGGWSSPTAINFVQHERNKVVFDEFVRLTQELFNVTPSIHNPSARPHMMVAQSGRRHLRRWLASIGLPEYGVHGKTIPDCILGGGTDIWKSYLAGLWDTDGHLGNHIELTLKERHIIQEIQVMLWTMGIPSSISPKKVKKYPNRTYWRISINGGKVAHSFSEIVSRMRNERKKAGYKQREIDPSVANASRFGDYTNIAGLVSKLWETGVKKGVKKDQFVLHTKTNKQFSRRTFEKLHKYLLDYDVELDNYLQWIYTKTIPLPIVEITNGEANVCDIGVPANNTFVTNGIISHNSLSAKAASNVLNIPLVKFDIARCFGGIVGQSEQNMRNALQTIDAIGNCVVWLDEMEKAFAGTGGSGSNDSGVTMRVFGQFLMWMQEKKTPSFIIATVNRIDNILASNPELLRKGRFDEIFFVGLPSASEREMILKIHSKKWRGKKAPTINWADAAQASNGFSGAELEDVMKVAVNYAFAADDNLETSELKHDFVMHAIKNSNPLSRSAASQLENMAKWASTNAVCASVATDSDVIGNVKFERRLDVE